LVNQQQTVNKRRIGRIGTPSLFILIAVGAVIALFVCAVLVDSALYYNKVHSGISVAGVDLGGQTKQEATTSLTALVDEARRSPITLVSGEHTWTLEPDAAGTHMDVEGAVAAALAVSREHNFFTDLGTRFKLYFTHKDLPLDGSVDDTKLGAFVAGIARELDIAPVNAALAIQGTTIKVIDAVQGQAVDQAQLQSELSALLVTLHATEVQVPIAVVEPAVTAEDNQAAQKQAETMISAPVTVTGGGKTWTVKAEEIASYMSFRSEMKNGVSTLVPYMDSTRLQPLLDEIAPDVLKKPTNASFKHDDAHAWVVAGKSGEELDPTATAEAITEATLDLAERTVSVVTEEVEPHLTTEEAEARGIKDKLSSYTTKYTGSSNRQVNVKITTKYATDVFLAPGEEYNFDKEIGARTAARGYKLAGGIVGPGQLEDVLGGGICQVSTTMFNAVAGGKAGLKIKERHNHSLYIDHYPKGRDATVTAGGKNLRFVNDTDHYIWITGSSNGITTTITVWGTDEGRSTKWTVGDFYNVVPMAKTTVLDPTMLEGKTKVTDEGQTGKSLKTQRVVTRKGKVIHKDTWVSVWPMYPQLVAVGTATTKPPTTGTTGSPPTTAPVTTDTTAP
jgi:vancomycin resistance protein YoaR